MSRIFYNFKTNRYNSLVIAKKNGLYTNPKQFQLPEGYGLDMFRRSVLPIKVLREQILSGRIPVDRFYLPNYIVLPKSKQLVARNPITLKQRHTQRRQIKKEADVVDYFSTVKLYKEIAVQDVRYFGPRAFKGDEDSAYGLVKEMKTKTTSSGVQAFDNTKTYKRTKEEDTEFNNLVILLEEDEAFLNFTKSEGFTYVDCIEIVHVSRRSRNTKPADPLAVLLHAANYNEFIYNPNIKNEVNTAAKKFSELYLEGDSIATKKEEEVAANSCYVNLIYAAYHKQFDALKPDGTRKHKELTKESLFTTLGLDTNRTQNVGLSIHNSVEFFKKHKIGLKVYDIFNTNIFTFTPEKPNKNISPDFLRVLVHNNHVYRINQNIKALEQHKKLEAAEEDEHKEYLDNNLYVSTDFNIIEDKEVETKSIMINELDDALPQIKANTDDEMNQVFLVNGKLEKVLFEMLKSKFNPSITFNSGKLDSITIAKNIKIRDCSIWSTDDTQNYQITNQTLYDNYYKAYMATYHAIICPSHKSEYNPRSKAIDDALPLGPLSGYFEQDVVRNVDEIVFITMKHVIIDIPALYNNTPITWCKWNKRNPIRAFYTTDVNETYPYLVEGSVNPFFTECTTKRYYVNESTGSDSNCGSHTEPYQTIERARAECVRLVDNIVATPSVIESMLNSISVSESTEQEITTTAAIPLHHKNTLCAVDMRKAYTSCLMDITNVPVFGHFDMYQKYDGHAIEDETMYVVECDKNVILFPTIISRSYGVKLKCAIKNKIAFTILQFKRPSQLVAAKFSKNINDLYATTIDTDDKNDKELKKKIVNTILGMTEKKSNSKSVSKLFSTYSMALHYQLKYGGVIYPLQDNEEITEVVQNEVGPIHSDLDFGIDDIECYGTRTVSNTTTNKLHRAYVLHIQAKAELTNGFLPIKELIYEIQKVKLFNLHKRCVRKNLSIVGVKTDCILVDETEEKLLSLFNTKDKIGGVKIETNKKCNDTKIQLTKGIDMAALMVLAAPIVVNNISIVDEWDTNEINAVFEKNAITLVKGEYPGVGKTYCVQQYKNDILFISPYNKLCQNLRKDGFESITLIKLLGRQALGDKLGIPMKGKNGGPFDVSNHTVICFDEVMLYGPCELRQIQNYMSKHTNIKFIATGDSDQLKPINASYNNIVGMQRHMNKCRDMVFPTQFSLNISKRLKNQEDRDKMAQLKADVFNPSISVSDICTTHNIRQVSDIKATTTKRNIAYFNYYAPIVNNIVHKLYATEDENNIIVRDNAYYKGLEVVCTTHMTAKGGVRLYVNYTYAIHTISAKYFTVIEPVDNEVIAHSFKISEIAKYFRLPYADTCHSIQGCTITEPMTIFNANIDSHVDRDFFWTALTRATDFNNVSVYIHGDAEKERLSVSRLKRYFNDKVKGYIIQDDNKSRKYDASEYITGDWIHEQYTKCHECLTCHAVYDIDFNEDYNMTSNITVDRINNDLAHTIDNCQLMCLHCNVSKK